MQGVTSEGMLLAQKAAAEARRPYVLAQKANLARLNQLIEDAETKKAYYSPESPGHKREMHLFYDGLVVGLRRAVMVFEGRG